MIEPQPASLQDFPESTASAEGMIVIEPHHAPIDSSMKLSIPYVHKSDRDLHLHVVLPPRPLDFPDLATDTYPCIIFVQGSAWLEQDLGQLLGSLAQFARRGYVIISVEYRPSFVAQFPAQICDVKSAIRYVREHAAELHVDRERMAIWGDSSGGHTAVMTMLTEGEAGYSDDSPEDLGLRCVVDFYGPTDISRMNREPSIMEHRAPDSPEGLLIGGKNVIENPDDVAPTIVMNHVPVRTEKVLPPILIMHGSKDRLVPFEQSVLLYERLRSADQDVTFYQLKGADHGGPAFWQPEVSAIVDQFLKENLA